MTIDNPSRPHSLRWFVGATIALLALTFPTIAQAQTLVLTLDEAQERAARHNPGFRRTTNSLELGGIQIREAWQSLLPRPSVTLLSSRMDWNLQTLGTDPFGNPVENPEARMVQSARTSQQASLNMTFDFANILRLNQQRDAVELQEATASSDLSFLRGQIALAFLDVQERQLALTLEEELFAEAEGSRQAVEQLYALARADRLALVSAELGLAEQENAVERSRADLANALLSLRNLMGDASVGEFAIQPAPLRTVDPEALDAERLVIIALQSNPTLIQQENALLDAGRSVTISRSQWLPRLTVTLSASRSELSRDGGNAFLSLSPDGPWDQNVGFSLSLPDVGNFLSTRSSTTRAKVTERNASETLRESRMQVEQDVHTRIVELQLAQRSLEIQERRAGLAEEAFAISLETYRMGGGSFDELQTASTSVGQTRRQALQARHTLERELISLERTLGVSLQDAGIAVRTGD